MPADSDSPLDSTPAPGDVGPRLARHERRLRLLLLHLAGRAVRARVEIDDLVQEVWVRAISVESLPAADTDDPSDTRLWHLLARLARHSVIDAARAIRAAKRDGCTLPLAHSDWSQGGARASRILARTWGPATRVAASELEQRLEARFQALAPEHQRVIGLRQFEGLSARDAAARMGRSETAVHSLYRRALLAWQALEDRSNAPQARDPGAREKNPNARDESTADDRP